MNSWTSKEECTYCLATGGGASTSTRNPCSGIYCHNPAKNNSLSSIIQGNLTQKYSSNKDFNNLKIVNDLIYNENTHVVSIFKDYLILDDINEFLKRSYTQTEARARLPKLCTFYDKYSQVFPNYVVLPESKYMFKNIQRKQKLIDDQYQIQEELAKKTQMSLLDEDRLFSSKFYNSVYDLSMSRYEEQAKTIMKKEGASTSDKFAAALRASSRGVNQMHLDELVEHFIARDSESNIELAQSDIIEMSGFSQQSMTIANEQVVSKPSTIVNKPI